MVKLFLTYKLPLKDTSFNTERRLFNDTSFATNKLRLNNTSFDTNNLLFKEASFCIIKLPVRLIISPPLTSTKPFT